MSMSGATVHAECITAYNELKLAKSLKYIIYKLSDDHKFIVVEEASNNQDYEVFREKLVNSTSKSKNGAEGKCPRYAVYDFEYRLASGDGVRTKITFIAWSPDDAGIMPKMVYASSKDALRRALPGVATEIQANDADDVEWETIVKTVSKGLANLEQPSVSAVQSPVFHKGLANLEQSPVAAAQSPVAVEQDPSPAAVGEM